MTTQQQNYGLIIVGVVLVLASALVDVVGIGNEGFGVAQIVGIVVGVILAGLGIYREYFRPPPAA
jgi:hypothetical membrane protein